jgi:beta-phosphoglucomutase-like phosphatase (HAD superfamily)
MSVNEDGPGQPDPAAGDRDGSPAVFADVRVLLCDADGNLFPSEEPAFAASVHVTNRFLAEHGVDRRYEAEELRLAATGMNYRKVLTWLAQQHQIPAEAVTGAALEQWVVLEKAAVTEHLAAVLRPDPEVLEPLALLARTYDLAAVSSSADARIKACFEVTGMAGYFGDQRRFSAEDSLPVPTSKPDPAIYLYAGEQLGIGPSQGLAVEDSVTGATSAVAAGFPTIGNLQFVQPDERAARKAALQEVGVAAIVSSWSEIVGLLPR